MRDTAVESVANEADNGKGPILELLPQAEAAPLNPLVVAALARIERAHVAAAGGGKFTSFSGTTVVAYAEQPEFGSEVSCNAEQHDSDSLSAPEVELQMGSAQPERVHNLAVVPNPPAPVESVDLEEEMSRAVLTPKRLIGDDVNHPALNYLDTIPTSSRVDDSLRSIAPIHLRIFASLIDLAIVGMLSWFPLAIAGLTNLAWQDRRALLLAVVTTIVVAFLYSTIGTALTGSTLGMKLFSLRVVDARTRMLPTGSQSAGRAMVYILSVASAGIPLMYTFIDRDKRGVHDRFTRTEVVRI